MLAFRPRDEEPFEAFHVFGVRRPQRRAAGGAGAPAALFQVAVGVRGAGAVLLIVVCTRLRFELISRVDGVATDADMKPQKNVPQAEHMPHVMPRATSSKSSGRVRQIKQRSAEEGCGCGCWCSGAAWVDGWAAFGAFPTVELGLTCVCCGWRSMDARSARDSVQAASACSCWPTCYNAILRAHRVHSRSKLSVMSEFKIAIPPRARVSVGRPGRAGASGGRAIDIA